MHCLPRVGQIDAATVKKVHFGGFSDDEEDEDDGVWALACRSAVTDPLSQPPRKKTKAEVMAEVISKSKEHKVSEPVSLSDYTG